MTINWTLRDVEVFLVLVETGSFRQTAAQVHLSQSAVSGVIARLEQSLGSRLLNRSTRHVELNEVGQAFHEHALRLVEQARLADGVVHDLQSIRKGRVRVATLPSLAATVLPLTFAKFRESHPDVDLQLFDVLSGPAFELVRDGRADLALTAADPDYADLTYRELLSDPFMLLIPHGHPLARSPGLPVRWLDALKYPQISMPPPTSVRQYTNRACMSHSIVFAPAFELEHIASIHAMVRAGLGVAALPLKAMDLVSLEGLTARRLIDPHVDRPIGLVTSRKRPLSHAARGMVELLEATLAATAAEVPSA